MNPFLKYFSKRISFRFVSSWYFTLLLFVWFGNDHFGKFYFPCFLTGKLSDISGLITFPFFLSSLILILLYPIGKIQKFIFNFWKNKKVKNSHSHEVWVKINPYFNFSTIQLDPKFEFKIFLLSNFIVISLFSLINLSQDWNNFIYQILFSNQNGTSDREDLFCIFPAIFINWIIFRTYQNSKKNSLDKLKICFAICFCSFTFLNTSPAPQKFIRIVKPENSQVYKKNEKVVFIFYLEDNKLDYKVFFHIHSGEMSKKIVLDINKLNPIYDDRLDKYYCVYKEISFNEEGEYIIGISRSGSPSRHEIISYTKVYIRNE